MSERLALIEDPQLRPFLPLLYVVWADGDLEDDERSAVEHQLAASPWLRPAARAAVTRLLDPREPPTSRERVALLEAVRRTAATLSPETRRTFGELARSIAASIASAPAASTTSAAPSTSTAADDADAVARAVDELAAALGVEGADPASILAGMDAPVAGLPRAVTAEAERAVAPEPRLDGAALRSWLDGPHAAVRAEVRRWLDDPARRAYGLPSAEYRELVYGWLGELAATGLPRLAFPGVTSDATDLGPFMVAFETLALGDLSLLVKLGVQFGLFGGSLFFLGSARHHALLADVAALRMPGCFAMSEVGHGSNVADLETTATFDAATRELVIHTPRESARKDWAGNAAVHARWATVFAQLDVAGERHGVHAVLVPIRDEAGALLPGVRAGDCGHKHGLNGVDNGRLWFDHVRVPVDNLLDRFARIDADGRYLSEIANPSRRFFTMLGTLVGGRICVGSAGVSAAKVALAIAVRYASRRRQFGPDGGTEQTLLEYRTHRLRLLPPLATTYVFHAGFEMLRRRFATEATSTDRRELEAEVAALKAIATWHATATIQACREACGGQGYLSVNRLGDLRADADVFTTFEGDNTVLLQLVAKSLLTGFRRQFAGNGVAGVLRHLTRRAWSKLADTNPVISHRTGREHLRDRAWQRSMFRRREDVLVADVANRLRKRLGDTLPDGTKIDANTAFLELQDRLVEAASAHAERLAFEWFLTHASEAPPHLHPTLDLVADLHALSRLDAQAAWFLQDGSFEPSKARAIHDEVATLADEVAPLAADLVDAFGIPDACLAAPIAFFDPAHPRWTADA